MSEEINTHPCGHSDDQFCLREKRRPTLLNMPTLLRRESPKPMECAIQWRRKRKTIDYAAKGIVATIDLAGHAFQGCHCVLYGSGDVGLGSARYVSKRLMHFVRGCRRALGAHRLDRISCGQSEGLRASHHDATGFELPPDPVFSEKLIQTAGKIGLEGAGIVLASELLVEAFGKVVDHVPRGIRNKVINFAGDVLGRPIVGIRPFQKDRTDDLSQAFCSQTRPVRQLNQADPQHLGSILPNSDLGVRRAVTEAF